MAFPNVRELTLDLREYTATWYNFEFLTALARERRLCITIHKLITAIDSLKVLKHIQKNRSLHYGILMRVVITKWFSDLLGSQPIGKEEFIVKRVRLGWMEEK